MSTVDNPVDRPLVCDQMCAEIDRANSDLGAALVAARAEIERMRLVFDAARVYRLSAKPGSGWDRDEARVVLFAAVDKLNVRDLLGAFPVTGEADREV